MPGTVTVACKLPHGLILRVFRMEQSHEQTPLGVRDVTVARDAGQRIKINGVAAPHGKSPMDAAGNFVTIERGFALTHNVDADSWEAWYAANKDTDMVRNRMIFASQKSDEVRGKARESERQRSGLEPMDPASDPRMPKQRTKLNGGSLAPLETASRAA